MNRSIFLAAPMPAMAEEPNRFTYRCTKRLEKEIRLVCTAAAITFLLMSDVGGIALGFLLPVFSAMFHLFFMELGGADIPAWIFSVSTLSAVEDFSNSTTGFADGAEYVIYKTALDSKLIVQTLVSAFGIGIALLTASFAVFRRRDLN